MPESRDAIAQYNAKLDSFLGPTSTMSDFRSLETGDFVDFIPNSWQMAAVKKQQLQRKRALSQNLRDARAAKAQQANKIKAV